MKVQGHLSEYPLRDLLTILINRRETARLEVDFESVPGIFHLKDGELRGAPVGPLQGFAAVNLALSLPETSFHFETLTTAPEATINDPIERLMLTRLLDLQVDDATDGDFDHKESGVSSMSQPINPQEVTRRSGTNVSLVSDQTPRVPLTPKRTFPNIQASALIISAPKTNRLLGIFGVTLAYVRGHALAACTAAILLLVVPAVIAITMNFGRDDDRPELDLVAQASDHSPGNRSDSGRSSANEVVKSALPADNSGYIGEKIAKPKPAVASLKSASSSAATAETASNQESTPRNDKAHSKHSTKLITVVMQIEAGRVSEAYVKDHHPGLEAYEATAIRLARQRRYSKDKAGTETVVVKVTGDQ